MKLSIFTVPHRCVSELSSKTVGVPNVKIKHFNCAVGSCEQEMRWERKKDERVENVEKSLRTMASPVP